MSGKIQVMKAETNVEQKVEKAVQIETVYGVMDNPLTGQRLEGQVEVEKMDNWIKSQVEAGKLRVVK